MDGVYLFGNIWYLQCDTRQLKLVPVVPILALTTEILDNAVGV